VQYDCDYIKTYTLSVLQCNTVSFLSVSFGTMTVAVKFLPNAFLNVYVRS